MKKKRIEKCSICRKYRQDDNPMAKCYECHKLFCYDHIIGGQIKDTMRKTDLIRDVCADCSASHGYYNIGTAHEPLR